MRRLLLNLKAELFFENKLIPMKQLILTIFLTVSLFANSQTEDVVWYTNMDEAFQVATAENKPMMLFFTGSDWCGWCVRLQKEVFETPDFEAWSKDVVLVEVDFPRGKTQDPNIKNQNQQLQSMFQVRGYPTIYFVNPEIKAEGKSNLSPLGKTGYVKGGPDKWLAVANSFVN